jgi:hypothetical protein
MKVTRSLSLAFNAIATVCLTIRAAIHDPAIYAVGVFCLGTAGCLAITQLLIKGEK